MATITAPASSNLLKRGSDTLSYAELVDITKRLKLKCDETPSIQDDVTESLSIQTSSKVESRPQNEPDRADLDYLEKLRFCSHIRFWYNNYNQLGEWNPHRKFILPSIEPLFRKVVSSMKKNQPVNIKQYHGLARQLGISYSGKTKPELASLLDVWIQRYCNKTLYDDYDD